jgi:hypothetical protein
MRILQSLTVGEDAEQRVKEHNQCQDGMPFWIRTSRKSRRCKGRKTKKSPEEGRESGYDVKTECLSGSGHQEEAADARVSPGQRRSDDQEIPEEGRESGYNVKDGMPIWIRTSKFDLMAQMCKIIFRWNKVCYRHRRVRDDVRRDLDTHFPETCRRSYDREIG